MSRRFVHLSPERSSHSSRSSRARSPELSGSASSSFDAGKRLPPVPPSQQSSNDTVAASQILIRPPPQLFVPRRRVEQLTEPRRSTSAPLWLQPNNIPISQRGRQQPGQEVNCASDRGRPAPPPISPILDSTNDASSHSSPAAASPPRRSASPAHVPHLAPSRPAPVRGNAKTVKGSSRQIYVPHKKQKPVPVKRTMSAEIRRLQRSRDPMMPRIAFGRVVRDVTNKVCEEMNVESRRWQSAALDALQITAENYLTNLLADAYLAAIHCRRVTLKPSDMLLALHLRPRDDPGKRQ